ncbi:MAG: hypothetical protein ACP5JV_11440, partial [Thermus sp.]
FGLLATSQDGVNWDFYNFYQDVGRMAGIAYGNGIAVVTSWVYSDNKVLVSNDGRNWRIVNNVPCGGFSAAFGSGIFAKTSTGELCTSP